MDTFYHFQTFLPCFRKTKQGILRLIPVLSVNQNEGIRFNAFTTLIPIIQQQPLHCFQYEKGQSVLGLLQTPLLQGSALSQDREQLEQ
mmetsp:Transcript_9432/g.13138  ORF Transcript_9432/g.13138 Transcript_9432/m.13138 type:complete len:88 (-) Transcript_9432:758-1021(-)